MSEFEWDPAKARSNLRKHGVSFADVPEALMDDRAITITDPDPEEARFLTLGADGQDRLLVVAWTWRGEAVRIISARKASPNEYRRYWRNV